MKPVDVHNYDTDENFERVTPLEEIPKKFRMQVSLPGGGKQIVDWRKAYNYNAGRAVMVECGSVAADAHKLLGE